MSDSTKQGPTPVDLAFHSLVPCFAVVVIGSVLNAWHGLDAHPLSATIVAASIVLGSGIPSYLGLLHDGRSPQTLRTVISLSLGAASLLFLVLPLPATLGPFSIEPRALFSWTLAAWYYSQVLRLVIVEQKAEFLPAAVVPVIAWPLTMIVMERFAIGIAFFLTFIFTIVCAFSPGPCSEASAD